MESQGVDTSNNSISRRNDGNASAYSFLEENSKKIEKARQEGVSSESEYAEALRRMAEEAHEKEVIENIKDPYDRIKRELKKDISKIQEEYKKKFEKFQQDENKMRDEIEKQIENSKLSVIEVIGVFVALFTFISTEFQVFRIFREPMAIAGLSLILLGAISFLVILFDFYILQARAIKNGAKTYSDEGKYWKGLIIRVKENPARTSLFILTFAFIVLGVVLFSFSGNDDITKEIDRSIEAEASKMRADLMRELENEQSAVLKEKDLEIEKNRIKELENRMEGIRGCVDTFGIVRGCFR